MKKTKEAGTRRRFLTLGLLGGAGLVTQPAQAMIPGAPEEDTVKMLTPDGRLVEVPKSAITAGNEKRKAGHQDLLDWSNANKPKQ